MMLPVLQSGFPAFAGVAVVLLGVAAAGLARDPNGLVSWCLPGLDLAARMSTLRVEGVTVRFGEVTAVDDVTLSVDAGGVTGLIGPNGAGKTTFFDVVSGLRRPSAGRVLLDGDDITAKGPHQRSRLGVARTFQRLEVFGSLTVWENVVVALESRRRPARLADDLLERVGIAEFAGPPGRHRADRRGAAAGTGPRAGHRPAPAAARRAVVRAGPAGDRRVRLAAARNSPPRGARSCWSSTTWTS